MDNENLVDIQMEDGIEYVDATGTALVHDIPEVAFFWWTGEKYYRKKKEVLPVMCQTSMK